MGQNFNGSSAALVCLNISDITVCVCVQGSEITLNKNQMQVKTGFNLYINCNIMHGLNCV